MAGRGGAERPEAPMAGEEEADRGRAIGAPGSGHPPPYVTLPAAHFQATGRGREQTLGCPGKLNYLGSGDHLPGAVRSLGRVSRRDVSRESYKISSRGCPQDRWFSRHWSASFSVRKAGDRVGGGGRLPGMSVRKRDGWSGRWKGVFWNQGYTWIPVGAPLVLFGHIRGSKHSRSSFLVCFVSPLKTTKD